MMLVAAGEFCESVYEIQSQILKTILLIARIKIRIRIGSEIRIGFRVSVSNP